MTDTPEHTQHVFKPTREHILAIVLATGIALMGILWAPKYLAWLLIFPAIWPVSYTHLTLPTKA